MKRKAFLFLFFTITFSAIWYYWSYSSKKSHSYLIELPVNLCNANIPHVQIKIEGQPYDAKIDLGFTGELSATESVVQKIEDKSWIGKIRSTGWNEKTFEKNVYLISSVSLPGSLYSLIYDKPYLWESSHHFEENAAIIGEKPTANDEIIRLGWKLFQTTPLLLDFQNLQILACDSLRTFKKHGHTLKGFIKTKLLTENKNLEIEAMTEKGPLRCELDTGATANAICRDCSDPRTIEEIMLDPNCIETVQKFEINGKNIGPVEFHIVPSRLRGKEDVVLGMEFFLKHRVFLDLPHREIYFQ